VVSLRAFLNRKRGCRGDEPSFEGARGSAMMAVHSGAPWSKQDLFFLKDSLRQGEIAPEPTGHGLPLSKCEAYNRVYEQPYGSS
jgi:hypothetical protein